MKALHLVGLTLVLVLAVGCGGVEVADEMDTTLSTQEAALDGGTLDGGSRDAGMTDGGSTDGGSYDAGTTDAGVRDGGSGFSCPSSVGINGRAAAASCCNSGNEPAGDNPESSCVSDWCVTQCKEDCGGSSLCYTPCYSACRNGVTCTCG